MLVLLAVVICLFIVVYLVNNGSKNPDALAAEVASRVVCPALMRPTLVCPLANNIDQSNQSQWWRRWWYPGRGRGCNWQCSPWPTPIPQPTSTPRPSAPCRPRPACLDRYPQCLMPEPIEGWCPRVNPSPIPKPSVCAGIVCPLNCLQVRSPETDSCGCQCGPPRMAQ